MVRTVQRLRERQVNVGILDLTAIGQNLSAEQWYDGLLAKLGQQLDLEDELDQFWQTQARFGPLQRWSTAWEKVILRRCSAPIVVFVDELDVVRSLPFSTDEFFAAIRPRGSLAGRNGRSLSADLVAQPFICALRSIFHWLTMR